MNNLADINTGEIYLYEVIDGNTSNDFLYKLKYLENSDNQTIKIRINSPGGNVFAGLSIFHAILNSPKNIETHVDGIAASIAGIIAMAGKKRYMCDFGKLMIHDPLFIKDKISDKEKNTIAETKDTLVRILTNNSLLKDTDIAELMAQETWFNSEEAKSFGFIDEVTQTQRSVVFNEVTDPFALYEITNSLLSPKPTQQTNKQTIKMDKLLNHFGLEATCDQDAVLNKVTDLENKLADKTTKETDLNNSIESLQNEVSKLKSEKAKIKVDKVIAEGKFKESARKSLTDLAISNESDFDQLVEGVSSGISKPASLVDLIDQSKNDKSKWTLSDWEQKDPSGLQNMIIEDPSKYAALSAERFNQKINK